MNDFFFPFFFCNFNFTQEILLMHPSKDPLGLHNMPDALYLIPKLNSLLNTSLCL